MSSPLTFWPIHSPPFWTTQEVIAALMTHIGSGMAAEIDHALDVLGSLVETHPSAMNRFAVLVKVGSILAAVVF